MKTSQKSQSELAKLNKHRRTNGEFGNRESEESTAVTLQALPEWTEDEINNPWGVEIEEVTPELDQPKPALEISEIAAPASTRSTRAFTEAAGISAEAFTAESAPLKSSEEVVLGAVHRNPDQSVDALCKANPGLAPGHARMILHNYTAHLERNIDSANWKDSLANSIEQAKKPLHESFVMRPDSNTVDKLGIEVDFAIYNAIKYGSLDDKMERIKFHQLLPNLPLGRADEIFDTATNLKKIEHEDWKKPIEDAVKEDAALAGHKFDYNYQPPGAVAVKGYGPNPHQGTLYSGWRSVTEINKDARAELKRAQKAGYLPASLKFSVRGESFSGGQAMRVSVTGVDRATQIEDGENYGRRSDLGRELNDRIESIINAWNHTDNDSMTDYFNTNYYTSINYDH